MSNLGQKVPIWNRLGAQKHHIAAKSIILLKETCHALFFVAFCSAMPIQNIVRVDGNVQWRWIIGKSGEYVAVCDPLQLTLQAATWAELMEDTADVLNAIFKDLMKSNELDTFLRDKGWNLIGQIPLQREDVTFDVPFFFVPEMARSNGSQRYLSQ